jgi:putative redox protein
MAHTPNATLAVWAGEQRFDTSRPGGPVARLDGTAQSGQSPVDALLSALSVCAGIDVVDILAKRRTPVERMTVEAEGTRRETHPRRFTAIQLTYRVDGAGIEPSQAERALALAIEKYCTVAASLAPDIAVRTIMVVNGVAGATVTQPLPG